MSGFTGDDPALVGTGFETHACTGWIVARGEVRPGAALVLAFFVADTGDDQRATGALLDGFRRDCAGCDPLDLECETP